MAEPTATVLRQSSLSLVYCRQVMSGQVSLPCSGRQSGTPRYILSECFIRVHCSRKRHSPNTKTLAILDSPIKSLKKRHQGVKRSISQYHNINKNLTAHRCGKRGEQKINYKCKERRERRPVGCVSPLTCLAHIQK